MYRTNKTATNHESIADLIKYSVIEPDWPWTEVII